MKFRRSAESAGATPPIPDASSELLDFHQRPGRRRRPNHSEIGRGISPERPGLSSPATAAAAAPTCREVGAGAAGFLESVLDASAEISAALGESAEALRASDTRGFAAAQLKAIEGGRKLAALWGI